MTRGVFLTFEGVEGAGKSTNLAAVREHLEKNSVDLLVTREPGGTQIAEGIRTLLLQPHDESMAAKAELLLMFAARVQHLQEVIRPALARGTWVLCDRFTDATYAYQGGGRGVDPTVIATIEALVHGDLQPDLTLYYDLAPEMGLQRHGEQRSLDRIERETLAFHTRVRSAYIERARLAKGRILIVDAARPLAEVIQESLALIDAWRVGRRLATASPL